MLVHCDEEEEEEEEEQEIEDESEEHSQGGSFELGEPPSLPPAPVLLAPQLPDTGIVITEPTPEVEHRPIVEEETDSSELQKERIEEEEEPVEEPVEEEAKPVRQNYYRPTTVEINVIESEKQVFSSDEESEPPPPPAAASERADTSAEPELPPLPAEAEPEKDNNKVEVELDDLPPPPELADIVPSPDETNEDDQLILKRLKQLKDTNNNFTASFDILDDSELTTAENSQSIEENPIEKFEMENRSEDIESEDRPVDREEKKDEERKEEDQPKEETKKEGETENKNEEDKKESDTAAGFSANFEANFEANFPEDEDLK